MIDSDYLEGFLEEEGEDEDEEMEEVIELFISQIEEMERATTADRVACCEGLNSLANVLEDAFDLKQQLLSNEKRQETLCFRLLVVAEDYDEVLEPCVYAVTFSFFSLLFIHTIPSFIATKSHSLFNPLVLSLECSWTSARFVQISGGVA